MQDEIRWAASCCPMNEGPESGQITWLESTCQHCHHWAIVKNDLAQHWPKLGWLKEISWITTGCQTRLRLSMNDAPESGQISRPNSCRRHCHHWVVLKVSVEGEHLIKSRRHFQSFGAATTKTQSPLPSSFNSGTVKRHFSEDLEQGQTSSERYRGASPCTALVKDNKLKNHEISPLMDR